MDLKFTFIYFIFISEASEEQYFSELNNSATRLSDLQTHSITEYLMFIFCNTE